MEQLTEALTWYFMTGEIKYFNEFDNLLKQNFKEKEHYPQWLLDELDIKPRSFVQIAYDKFKKRLNPDFDFKRNFNYLKPLIEDVYEPISN